MTPEQRIAALRAAADELEQAHRADEQIDVAWWWLRDRADDIEAEQKEKRPLALPYADHPDNDEQSAEKDAWTVVYRGVPLTLTRAQYLALKRAADEDPVEADRLAREHLARVAPPGSSERSEGRG